MLYKKFVLITTTETGPNANQIQLEPISEDAILNLVDQIYGYDERSSLQEWIKDTCFKPGAIYQRGNIVFVRTEG